MLPHALFLEAAAEAFDHPVLFRRLRRDELLAQPVVLARGAEAPTQEDALSLRSTGVSPAGRSVPKRSMHAASSALGFLGAAPAGELVADELAIVAVNHRREMRPAVAPAIDVGDVHRPALVTPARATPPTLHAWTRRRPPLMDEPPLEHEHAVHGFPVDPQSLMEAEQRPQSSVAECRVLTIERCRRRARTSSTTGTRGVSGRSRTAEHGTLITAQTRRSETFGMACFTRRTSSGP